MKRHNIAVVAVSLALGAYGDAQALSAFVQTNAIEREVQAGDQSQFQGEAVSLKLEFANPRSVDVTRVLQLYGSVEQTRGSDADESYQFNNLALSQEVRRWSDATQRYAFFAYGLSLAQYHLPEVNEADFVGFRLAGGAGYPLFRNRVILTTDLDLQLLQEFDADDSSREAELGAVVGKVGLLWSFDHFGVSASYSYRYLTYYQSDTGEIADVSQMLGIGVGFALD